MTFRSACVLLNPQISNPQKETIVALLLSRNFRRGRGWNDWARLTVARLNDSDATLQRPGKSTRKHVVSRSTTKYLWQPRQEGDFLMCSLPSAAKVGCTVAVPLTTTPPRTPPPRSSSCPSQTQSPEWCHYNQEERTG
ncbi:hypothetical protein DQ04_01021010 [Trypanosoma grayi]|uniref:hypothetical protein n=1 Tax=Trypanosoma grayi TaxID=71804 RepID=UPI0004F466D4|nr:hypothetical protein DQ04_01021010 [Trypanosoma grayi]KEG13400.1 hypothetical protein DQ04_01021010 [Trypanosoma grayi]